MLNKIHALLRAHDIRYANLYAASDGSIQIEMYGKVSTTHDRLTAAGLYVVGAVQDYLDDDPYVLAKISLPDEQPVEAPGDPIEAIRARCVAATSGLWQIVDDDLTVRVREWRHCTQMGDYRGCIIADFKPALGASSTEDVPAAKQARDHAWPETQANMEFVAHAPQDIQTLLAEVDRLKTALSEMEEAAYTAQALYLAEKDRHNRTMQDMRDMTAELDALPSTDADPLTQVYQYAENILNIIRSASTGATSLIYDDLLLHAKEITELIHDYDLEHLDEGFTE